MYVTMRYVENGPDIMSDLCLLNLHFRLLLSVLLVFFLKKKKDTASFRTHILRYVHNLMSTELDNP